MSITDGLRKVFDDCTVMAGVEADFECVYIAKSAALKLLDEVDEAFAEGHARAVEYGKASVTDESRWHELFGTPERAARTLADWGVDARGYDALLEWLRGDAS